MLSNAISFYKESRFPYRPYLNKNKCIFIHIPKSAGSSILDRLGKKGKMNRDHLPWYIYQKANPIKFKRFFKFSFVRNPWDRAYSAFSYLRGGGNGASDLKLQALLDRFDGYDDFLINGLNKGLLRNHILFIPQSFFVLDANQNPMVDFLGRYENLEEDYKKIAEKLSLQTDLPYFNRTREKKQKYQCSESINIIANIYAQDVDVFQYNYEERGL
ncbi:sulfotransferase family 2 domain-containing protein [Alloalcanivorax marinus]|uniref:sulfotransferase family 2 domain-containing protein n=1 Tax=Alloalcanivorax marinus TaxID=1177169 RepID=UPI001958336E|nr:sulfotransferase family 2 domain-containing protein [Alloalcanivorax marinus]MBM7333635.1 sulfotransferase family 2 domain-containing protein [Alloalcanivorax marinus]